MAISDGRAMRPNRMRAENSFSHIGWASGVGLFLRSVVLSCVPCGHREERDACDPPVADPGYCEFCNS